MLTGQNKVLQFSSCQCIFILSSLAVDISPFYSWCRKITYKGEEKKREALFFGVQPSLLVRRELASLLKAQIILGVSKFTPILAFGKPASLQPLVIQRQWLCKPQPQLPSQGLAPSIAVLQSLLCPRVLQLKGLTEHFANLTQLNFSGS